jgi:hypothetical protein
LAIGAAAGVIFLVSVIWPRPGQVVLSALLGAPILLSGALLVAIRLKPEMWTRAMDSPGYVLSGLGALVLIGTVVQAWQLARAAKRRAGEGPS